MLPIYAMSSDASSLDRWFERALLQQQRETIVLEVLSGPLVKSNLTPHFPRLW